MNFSESSFEIVKNQNCLFYSMGDKFEVTGRSVFMKGKPTCLTLMSDITEALVKCQGASHSKEGLSEHFFSCSGYMSGCPGKIQIQYTREKKTTEKISWQAETADNAVACELISFSIFKTLSEPEIKELASFFKTKKFRQNEIILRKGDRGEKFFVILSGNVEVVGDYGVSIATLGKGEVFGEMSLLTGSPVSAKIRAVEDTTVMYMYGNHFRIMLNRFSPLQMYFTRLLARRLSQSNIDRSKEVTVGMAGSLSEISVAELLQALNMSQKTGILSLKLPRGSARILIREGELLSAKYDYWIGEKAIFELLKEKSGEFKFKPGLPPKEMDLPAMGNFMYLLMEGIRLMDENSIPSEAPDEEHGHKGDDELIFD
jgi:CRP/FNR family transcriptional regulator, cyclic AMP receptor protein